MGNTTSAPTPDTAARARLEVFTICGDDDAGISTVHLRFNDVRYTLHVCADCCRGTEIRYCNGTTTYQFWENTTCTHLFAPLPTIDHIDSEHRHHMYGRPAYEMLHGRITDHLLSIDEGHPVRGLLKPVLDPIIEYKHTGRIYSANPDFIMHGSKGIFKSFFFARCNGQHVNGVGEVMEGGGEPRGLDLHEIEEMEEFVARGMMTLGELAEDSWLAAGN